MPTPEEIIERSRADRAAAGPTVIAKNMDVVLNGIGASPRNYVILNFAALAVERGWTRIVAALSRPTPGQRP